MDTNRAALLLRRMQARHRDRAQNTVLYPFAIQALVSIWLLILFLTDAPVHAYVVALVITTLFTAALLLLCMLVIDSEMMELAAESYFLSQKVNVRTVTFEVEAHIVGRSE